VTELLEHPQQARALGRNGHLVVRRRLLSHRHLTEWAALLTGVIGRPRTADGATLTSATVVDVNAA
jgi:hypothetical protein